MKLTLHSQADSKDFDPSDFRDVLSAMASTKSSTPSPKVTQLTKPQLFQALYLFAMIYLQKYPDKTISFFEYLFYLQQQAPFLTAPGLVHLDSELRASYIANPTWNWTQDHPKLAKKWETIKSNPAYLKYSPNQFGSQQKPDPTSKLSTSPQSPDLDPNPVLHHDRRRSLKSVGTGTGEHAPDLTANFDTHASNAEAVIRKTNANDAHSSGSLI